MNQPVKPPVKPDILLPRKGDNSQLLLAGGAIVLLLGVGAVAGWLLWLRPLWEAALPMGARLLPTDVLMTASVSTKTAQWQQLRGLGTPQSRSLVDQNLVQLRDRLLTSNGLDYQKDIQPWVGEEITIAVLPAAQNMARN